MRGVNIGWALWGVNIGWALWDVNIGWALAHDQGFYNLNIGGGGGGLQTFQTPFLRHCCTTLTPILYAECIGGTGTEDVKYGVALF